MLTAPKRGSSARSHKPPVRGYRRFRIAASSRAATTSWPRPGFAATASSSGIDAVYPPARAAVVASVTRSASPGRAPPRSSAGKAATATSQMVCYGSASKSSSSATANSPRTTSGFAGNSRTLSDNSAPPAYQHWPNQQRNHLQPIAVR